MRSMHVARCCTTRHAPEKSDCVRLVLQCHRRNGIRNARMAVHLRDQRPREFAPAHLSADACA